MIAPTDIIRLEAQAVVMQENLNLFPSGAAWEALCGWSDSLKSFQQGVGKY